MAQERFRCSGDCLQCHPNQRAYCASQFTYNTMRMVEDMQNRVAEIEKKIDSLQEENVDVFDPMKSNQSNDLDKSNPTEIAHDGDGAQNKSPI